MHAFFDDAILGDITEIIFMLGERFLPGTLCPALSCDMKSMKNGQE
jgi:hypothetical protein